MNSHRARRGDRVERVLRSLLGLALVAAVVWAWVHNGPATPPGFANRLLP